MNNPIRIGYSLSLSGPVAANTKAVMLAHRIWEDDINRKGGLLGRKIELVCYDDHGDASQVSERYKQLSGFARTSFRFATGMSEKGIYNAYNQHHCVANALLGTS